jgi:polar amino acid transport system substrate-binding protein
MRKIMGMAVAGILLWVNGALGGELRIWTVDEPPASFLDKNNKISGFAVDIVKAIEERLGRADTIEIVPEARVYQVALREPNVVLFSFSRTPEREESFHWISLIIRKPWVLYAAKNSGIQIKNIDDAKRVNLIGVVRGDVRAVWLKRQGFKNLEEVTQHEQNVLKLHAGRFS